jgi:hypothetical protein
MSARQFRVNSESIQRNWQQGNKADKYSNARRWRVALPAFRAVGARDGRTQQIANAIQSANNAETPLRDAQEATTDTVERLARAYKYFYKLLEIDSLKARRARRQYGYSRFAVLWDMWLNYEFSIAEKGFEYLELSMGNKALELFVMDAEDAAPEWKRRAAGMYSSASKLLTDLDVPKELRAAAESYIAEYDKAFPKPPKDLRRKV